MVIVRRNPTCALLAPLTDREFARAIEGGEVPNAEFHHREHLRLAWTYLAESGTLEEATGRIVAAIQRFAAAAGAAQKYHETLTVFWMRVLWRVREQKGVAAGFEDVLRSEPRLLDKDLPLAYYSGGRLFSEDARRSWLEPDLQPLEGFDRHDSTPRPGHPSSDPPDRALPRRPA